MSAVQSKERCKDQELIQSSTTPDPGYQWESDKLTEDTPNRANFAGEEELRELPGVGARVAKNIVRFREENFPITPANIHDIHKLRTSKRLLQLIDFTDKPAHAKGRSRPTYQPQEYF